MKSRGWASLFLAAFMGLWALPVDAAYTRIDTGLLAIESALLQAPPPAVAEIPADAWIVESIIPLGTTADGQPLALISFLVPLSSLDELSPASTRAGPYAAPETHTRVFCIVQPPLGLAANVIELNMPSIGAYSHPYAFGGDWDDASDFRALELGPVEGLLKGTAEGMMGAAALPGTYVHVTAAAKGAEYAENHMYLGSSWHASVATFNPAYTGLAAGDEAISGIGLRYYNSGDALSALQRVLSAGESLVAWGETAAIAYIGAKLIGPRIQNLPANNGLVHMTESSEIINRGKVLGKPSNLYAGPSSKRGGGVRSR